MSDKPKKKRGRQTKSNEELQERVEYALRMLCRRMYKHQMKRAIVGKYKVSSRMAENYISRARKQLKKKVNKKHDTLVREALDVYRSIIADPAASDRDIIMAQNSIDRLLGLEAPKELKHSGKVEGSAPKVEIYLPDNGRHPSSSQNGTSQVRNGIAATNGHSPHPPPGGSARDDAVKPG